MLLLFDIGNTHTHVGLATANRVVRQTNISTRDWPSPSTLRQVKAFVGRKRVDRIALCSVVPRATSCVKEAMQREYGKNAFILTARSVRGVGIRYPRPDSIGPDRLANAVAARHYFAAPVVVVDFGTAVTFDVVDSRGDYVGGIIAPGLSAMTEYLHEKTALLPRIRIREVDAVIGKNTEEAMLIGAVRGYRGLVRELIAGLKKELKSRRLPVIATGGYARLMAANLPEITAVIPGLTLEGLRLACTAAAAPAHGPERENRRAASSSSSSPREERAGRGPRRGETN